MSACFPPIECSCNAQPSTLSPVVIRWSVAAVSAWVQVMAGLAAQAKQSGYQTLLISTDKDLWQVGQASTQAGRQVPDLVWSACTSIR